MCKQLAYGVPWSCVSVNMSVCQFVRLHVHLSVCLSVRMSLHMSVCLSVNRCSIFHSFVCRLLVKLVYPNCYKCCSRTCIRFGWSVCSSVWLSVHGFAVVCLSIRLCRSLCLQHIIAPQFRNTVKIHKIQNRTKPIAFVQEEPSHNPTPENANTPKPHWKGKSNLVIWWEFLRSL